MYDSSEYFSLQIQSLLINKVKLSAVALHMYRAMRFHLHYHSIYLQKNLHACLQFGLHEVFTVISFQELNCMCNLEVTHCFYCSSWTTKYLGHSRHLFSHGSVFHSVKLTKMLSCSGHELSLRKCPCLLQDFKLW